MRENAFDAGEEGAFQKQFEQKSGGYVPPLPSNIAPVMEPSLVNGLVCLVCVLDSGGCLLLVFLFFLLKC